MIGAKIPATTANLGPGFDCMGAALSLFNHLEIDFARHSEIVLQGEVGQGVPRDETNLVYRAAKTLLDRFGEGRALFLRSTNFIPPARGLGSSAACIAGGMMAANALMGCPASQDEILALASRMEGHPDNVVSAVLGGLTLAILEGETVLYRRLELPPGIVVVVAIPDFCLSTEKARRAVPATVSHSDAVYNVARAAMMVACLAQGDVSLLGVLCRDRLHQPYRSHLVPGLDEMLEGACGRGALACYLSGAGPSVACLAVESSATAVGGFMVETFAAHGIKAYCKTLAPCVSGIEVTRR